MPAGSLRAEVQLASFEKTFISQQNRDLLLQALRKQILQLMGDGKMSMLVCSLLHHLRVDKVQPVITCT